MIPLESSGYWFTIWPFWVGIFVGLIIGGTAVAVEGAFRRWRQARRQRPVI